MTPQRNWGQGKGMQRKKENLKMKVQNTGNKERIN